MNDDLIKIIEEFGNPQTRQLMGQIDELSTRKDFVVGVVGEFKRGKSSLINSIISRELLPSDVLPATAAICIIKSAEKEEIVLRYTDGGREVFPCNKSVLERISKGGDILPERIKQATVKLVNSPIKDIIFIDTPGVNDLSEFRIQLTYDILPNCDSIVFLLDHAAPMKKTEAKFLEDKIISLGISELIFVLSKVDLLSDVEVEQSLEGARERIMKVVTKEPKILAYSSVTDSELNSKKLLDLLEELRNNAFSSRQFRIQILEKRIISVLSKEIEQRIAVIESQIQAGTQQKREGDYNLSEENLNLKNWLMTTGERFESVLEKLNTEFTTQSEVMTSDFVNELKSYEGNPEKYIKSILPGRMERDLIRFTKSIESRLSKEFEAIGEYVDQSCQRQFGFQIDLRLEDLSGKLIKYRGNSESFEDYTMVKRSASAMGGMIIGSLILPGVGSVIGSMVGVLGTEIFSRKVNKEMKEDILRSLPYQIEATVLKFKNLTFETLNQISNSYKSELERLLLDKVYEKKEFAQKNLNLSIEQLVVKKGHYLEVLNTLKGFPKYLTR